MGNVNSEYSVSISEMLNQNFLPYIKQVQVCKKDINDETTSVSICVKVRWGRLSPYTETLINEQPVSPDELKAVAINGQINMYDILDKVGALAH